MTHLSLLEQKFRAVAVHLSEIRRSPDRTPAHALTVRTNGGEAALLEDVLAAFRVLGFSVEDVLAAFRLKRGGRARRLQALAWRRARCLQGIGFSVEDVLAAFRYLYKAIRALGY
eukprot:5634092-Pyramimonas_sp.AAC.1